LSKIWWDELNRRLSLRQKISLASGLAICAAIFTISLVHLINESLEKQAWQQYQQAQQQADLLSQLKIAVGEVQINKQQLAFHLKNPAQFREEYQSFLRLVEQVKQLSAALKSQPSSKFSRLKSTDLVLFLQGYQKSVDEYHQKITTIIKQSDRPNLSPAAIDQIKVLLARENYIQIEQQSNKIFRNLSNLIEVANQEKIAATIAIEKTQKLQFQLSLAGGLLLVAIATTIAIYTSRAIAQSLEIFAKAAPTTNEVTNLPLLAPINSDRKVEYLTNFLNQLIQRIVVSAEELPQLAANQDLEQIEANLQQAKAIIESSVEARNAALKESEQRWRDLSAATFEGIAVHEAGMIVDANQSLANMFGWQISELIGMNKLQLLAPECRELVQKHLVSSNEQPYEAIGLKKDGSTFPVEIQGKIIHYQGHLARVAAWRDITARKVVEIAQLESEQAKKTQARLTAILEATTDFVGIADAQGRILYINQSGRRMVGIGENEALIGMRISDVRPIEDPDGNTAKSRAVSIQTGSWSGETFLRHRHGKIIPVSQVLICHKSDNGEVEFFSTIMRDISDRQLIELRLRQSETQYRQLAHRKELLNQLSSQIRNSLNVNTILEIAVREISNFLEIDRCNFVWYRHNDQPPTWDVVKEAKRSDLPSLLGSYPVINDPIYHKIVNLEIFRGDNLMTSDDPICQEIHREWGFTAFLALPIKMLFGDEISVVICGHYSEHRPWTDEEIELLQAVCDQIAIALFQAKLYSQAQESTRQAQEQTQQLQQALRQLQQTQAQLVQSEKMSSLGQLVAGIAHEINNPVNFIHGNITCISDYAQELLSLLSLYQEFCPNPNPELAEAVRAIDLDFIAEDLPKILKSMQIGTNRIQQIVLSLRNFSRLDESNMKEVDIHEGIENTLLMLQNRVKAAHQQGTNIEIIKDYGQLPLVECYASQLNQVVFNILHNAIDALEERSHPGKISLSTTIGQVRSDPVSHPLYAQPHIAIKVADNGIGMTAEVKSRLFDPFFTTKPVGKGTGLGLSISYQIVVEQHGGILECFSELGQGTEFWIKIPIKQGSRELEE